MQHYKRRDLFFSSWYSQFCLGSSDKLHQQKKLLGLNNCVSRVGCQSVIPVCQHIPPAGEERPHTKFPEVFTWGRGKLWKGSEYSISKRRPRHCEVRESSGCSEPIQKHIPAWHTSSQLQSEFLVRDDPQPDMQPFLGFWHDLLPTSMAGSCFMWGFIAGSQGFWDPTAVGPAGCEMGTQSCICTTLWACHGRKCFF